MSRVKHGEIKTPSYQRGNIWGKSNTRMEKNELVLRGLGYWFAELSRIHEKNLDAYLVEAMKTINKTEKTIRGIKVRKFLFAYKACITIFDDQVFRKISEQRKNTVNKNIYETWMAINKLQLFSRMVWKTKRILTSI